MLAEEKQKPEIIENIIVENRRCPEHLPVQFNAHKHMHGDSWLQVLSNPT